MKISELNTKSFLGGAGAAANSYVLINYEDNSTSEPVTYKTSLQELGKAIANDLKLPAVTVSEGAITNFKVKGVSNGAYTETVVAAPTGGGSWVNESGIAYTDEETEATYKGVVYALNDACMPTLYEMTECSPSPIPPIGYFDETNSVKYTPVFLSDEDSGLYTIDEEADITAVPLTVSGSDVAHAVYTSDNDDYRNILYKTESGIPTLYYMTQNSGPRPLRALAFDASQHTYEPIYYRNGETYTADASGRPVEIFLTNGLASTGYVTSAINTATSGLASTGYVTNAISGLASTGYVTAAVANAGGGVSFDPIEYEESEYENSRIIFISDTHLLGYYSGGASTFIPVDNYVWYDETNHALTYHNDIHDYTLDVVWKDSGVAYIDSSDNKPCIRDEYGDFVGFLSIT